MKLIRKKKNSLSHLVHLRAQQVFVVVVRWHQVLNNIDEAPEGILLIEKKQGNGSQAIESLKKISRQRAISVRQWFSGRMLSF